MFLIQKYVSQTHQQWANSRWAELAHLMALSIYLLACVYSIRGPQTFHNHIVGFKEKVKRHRRLLIDLRNLTVIVVSRKFIFARFTSVFSKEFD
jgi:uncharacterized UPF0146 family protein